MPVGTSNQIRPGPDANGCSFPQRRLKGQCSYSFLLKYPSKFALFMRITTHLCLGSNLIPLARWEQPESQPSFFSALIAFEGVKHYHISHTHTYIYISLSLYIYLYLSTSLSLYILMVVCWLTILSLLHAKALGWLGSLPRFSFAILRASRYIWLMARGCRSWRWNTCMRPMFQRSSSNSSNPRNLEGPCQCYQWLQPRKPPRCWWCGGCQGAERIFGEYGIQVNTAFLLFCYRSVSQHPFLTGRRI